MGELINKIKDYFVRQGNVKLIETAQGQGQSAWGEKHGKLINNLKVNEDGTIDMQEKFESLTEIYQNVLLDLKVLLDKMYLAYFDIKYSENIDYGEIERMKMENIAKEARKSKNISKGFETVMVPVYIELYQEEAFKNYIDFNKKRKLGETVILSQQEQKAVDYIQQLIEFETQLSDALGAIEGIKYVTCKRGLNTEKNMKIQESIDTRMDKLREFAQKFATLAKAKGIEKGKAKDIDKLLLETEQFELIYSAWLYYIEHEGFINTVNFYEDYLAKGGKPVDYGCVDTELEEIPECESDSEISTFLDEELEKMGNNVRTVILRE